MMNDTYYGTKCIRSTGMSIAVNLPSEWPFEKGDVVQFTIRKMGDTEDITAIKNVCKSGSSLCVYCNKEWGMNKDDMVVFSVRLDEDGGRKATGRRLKIKNKGISGV